MVWPMRRWASISSQRLRDTASPAIRCINSRSPSCSISSTGRPSQAATAVSHQPVTSAPRSSHVADRDAACGRARRAERRAGAQPRAVELVARVARDQRAVEVEEGADLRARRLPPRPRRSVRSGRSCASPGGFAVRASSRSAATRRTDVVDLGRERARARRAAPRRPGSMRSRLAARRSAPRNSSRDTDSGLSSRRCSTYWRPTPDAFAQERRSRRPRSAGRVPPVGSATTA